MATTDMHIFSGVIFVYNILTSTLEKLAANDAFPAARRTLDALIVGVGEGWRETFEIGCARRHIATPFGLPVGLGDAAVETLDAAAMTQRLSTLMLQLVDGGILFPLVANDATIKGVHGIYAYSGCVVKR